MTPEMNDQTTADIALTNRGFSGSGEFRYWLEIFPESFWVRPWDRPPLSSQRVNDEIRAIRAEPHFGPAVHAVVQFAAPEQIRQPELLGDCRAKSFAGETSNFDSGRLARVPINLDPRFQSHRAEILRERNPATVPRQLDLSPSWPRRCTTRKPHFVRAVRR